MGKVGVAAEAGRFATVVIDDYGQYPCLPQLRGHADQVVSLLAKLGFEAAGQLCAPAEETAATVREWLGALRPPGRRLLVYWAGHAGRRQADDLWLYCRDTGDPPMAATAIAGSELGEYLAEQPAREIVLILDACHAGIGINAIVSAFRGVTEGRAYPDRRPGLAVISSASSYQPAREGVFAPALVTILRDGPPEPSDSYTGWTSRDALITPNDLADAIEEHLKRSGSRQRPDYLQSRTVGGFFPFLPNLGYRPDQSDVLVESRRCGAFADDEIAEHFLVKFRGIDADGTDGTDGWFFAGRAQPLRRIISWLRLGSGMLVVTGPPGSGKSAIMGRLAVLSVPAYRRQAEAAGVLAGADSDTLPAPDSISAGVHAKGKTLRDCISVRRRSGWVADRAFRPLAVVTILVLCSGLPGWVSRRLGGDVLQAKTALPARLAASGRAVVWRTDGDADVDGSRGSGSGRAAGWRAGCWCARSAGRGCWAGMAGCLPGGCAARTGRWCC